MFTLATVDFALCSGTLCLASASYCFLVQLSLGSPKSASQYSIFLSFTEGEFAGSAWLSGFARFFQGSNLLLIRLLCLARPFIQLAML